MTAIEALLARPFVARVGWGLLHSTWEIAALALIAVIALRLLRRGSPQSRYLVACATLVLMVLGPACTV
jgi:hypothetical protein